MSVRRAALVLAITCCIATTATAEPAPTRSGRTAYLQASTGLAFGWLDYTSTYTDVDTNGEGSSVERLSSHGLGARFGVTGGFDLGNGVRAGVFARFAILRMTIEHTLPPIVTRTDVKTVILGPAVTLSISDHLHVRAEVGTGALRAVSDRGELLGTLELGGQLGYERALRGGNRVALALALAATWTGGREDADRGYYDDRTRLLSAALVLSVAHGRY